MRTNESHHASGRRIHVLHVDDEPGFGLAIVERLADAHGWSVAVTESEAGGARFEFTGVGDD